MSKFIDNLTKLTQIEQKPMGFMLQTKAAPEKPRLQVIAKITAEVLEKSAQNLAKADALILDIVKADDVSVLEKAAAAKEGPTIGGRLKTLSAAAAKKALNSGCDFLVISPDAPVSLTHDEKMGKVLELEAGLSDILLRTSADLPVGAVIALEKEVGETLTLNRLMELHRLVYLIKPPLLVRVPLSFSVEELQILCDMGIKGVLVEVVDAKDVEKLADLHKAIAQLKKPAPHKKDKMTAMVPSIQSAVTPPLEEDGGDGEEEDEDE